MLGPSLSSDEHWANCIECGVEFVHLAGTPFCCSQCEESVKQQLYDGLNGVSSYPDSAGVAP